MIFVIMVIRRACVKNLFRLTLRRHFAVMNVKNLYLVRY